MRKTKQPQHRFLKYASVSPDLSSRRGFETGPDWPIEKPPSRRARRKNSNDNIFGMDSVYPQPLHPFTNSIRLRSAIPDGPLAIHGLFSSIHAVPAMSR